MILCVLIARKIQRTDKTYVPANHHVNCCANEDAVVEGPEEGDKEANKARHQIDPFKIALY